MSSEKALYGLKQAPRALVNRIDDYFQKNEFMKCTYEHTLFIKEKEGILLIICLYVDELVIMSNSPNLINTCKKSMNQSL
ncbi:putative RNA-directed DNA polymerase [Helianthus annuus]|nr:putative RNA-directed DNA polymerase [Helianthus annuus]